MVEGHADAALPLLFIVQLFRSPSLVESYSMQEFAPEVVYPWESAARKHDFLLNDWRESDFGT